MGQSELLLLLCKHLNKLGVRYLVTGSQATIAFGEPRFTIDIDVVVELDQHTLDAFCNGFSEEEFYLSRDAARQAVADQGMFNVIHPESGLKIDVIIPESTPFDQLRLSRGVRIPLADDCDAIFTSPEDIILKKMEWHQMGGGERHLSDIQGILKIHGSKLDCDYITQQATQLNLQDLWQSISQNL